MDDLKNELKNEKLERTNLKNEIHNLKLAKEAFEKKKNSTNKESDVIKEDLKYLHSLIEKGKCSHIESNLKEVPAKLAENSKLEIPVAENKTIDIESLTVPAVTNYDNIKQQSTAPNSVTKTIHKANGKAESHQLLNNSEVDSTLTKVNSNNIIISNHPTTGSLNLKESDKLNDNTKDKIKFNDKATDEAKWDFLIDRIFNPIELFIK